MRNLMSKQGASTIVGRWIGLAVLLAGLAGCKQPKPVEAVPTLVPSQPAAEQRLFDTSEAAAQAVVDIAKARDQDNLRQAIFGPAAKDMLSGDPVADAKSFEMFASHAAEKTRLEKQTDDKYVMLIGKEDWPFAIPIVKAANGKWFFDTASGMSEILARRIGRNELEAIETCREYLQAQREYAGKDRDGSGVLKCAQRIRSTPGKKDGLYWVAAPGEEKSPFGDLIAEAATEGYALDQRGAMRATPFYGYRFRILKAQGPAAPGGKHGYVINGNMIAGFALVAYPATYRSSGVMTFIISNQGRLYQKDLGPKTDEIAKKMTEYNPDGTWTLVEK